MHLADRKKSDGTKNYRLKLLQGKINSINGQNQGFSGLHIACYISLVLLKLMLEWRQRGEFEVLHFDAKMLLRSLTLTKRKRNQTGKDDVIFES